MQAKEMNANNNNMNIPPVVTIVFIFLVRLAAANGFYLSPINRSRGDRSRHNYRVCPPRLKYHTGRPGCFALSRALRQLHGPANSLKNRLARTQPTDSDVCRKTHSMMMSFGQNENDDEGIIIDNGRDYGDAWRGNKLVGKEDLESYCYQPELQIGHGDIGPGPVKEKSAAVAFNDENVIRTTVEESAAAGTLEQMDTLNELQKAVLALELEVQELQREDGVKIITGSCTFTREGNTQEPVTEGRDFLLYLPGVDGLNVEAVEQFDYLSASFDTWCMTVQGTDRSNFDQLTDQVIEFMNIAGVTEEKKVVIVGSSFGSLLALHVAHQCPAQVKGLALVNPATSFDRSHWRVLGSFVANAPGPEAFGMAATLCLATTLPDTAMVSRYMQEFEALPPHEIAAKFKGLTREWFDHVSSLFDEKPQEQLRWRLTNWLQAGSDRVEPLLRQVSLPVLVLAGSEDHMLPSLEEAERLSNIIPSCQQIVLRGVGHAALHDPGKVNLCRLLQSSVIYDHRLLDRTVQRKEAKRASKRWHKDSFCNIDCGGVGEFQSPERLEETAIGGDSVLDFTLDLDDDMVGLAWRRTQTLDFFTSPVFLSVNVDGELEEGLGGVPDHKEGCSILFVGNHQLLGIDIPILVRKLLVDKNILVRGLAHPVVTGGGDGDFINKIREKNGSVNNPVNNQTTGAHGTVGAARRAASSIVHAVGATAGHVGSTGLTGINDVVKASVKSASRASSLARRVVHRGGQRGTGGSNGHGNSTAASSISELVSGMLEKLGAVAVTPRNMFKLFKAGECMLLYPGGAKEALHQKGQDYRMFWPEKSEFARMAASCNATIVPVAAVGSADSMEILMDLEDIFALPFGVGEKMQDAASFIPRARHGDDKEYFLPPLVRPKVPARHYFVFGRPIDTTEVDEKDRKACQRVYDRARLSVDAGVQYLLDARQHDPYSDNTKRLLYEAVMRTQAPTFPLDAATVHYEARKTGDDFIATGTRSDL